MNAGPATGCLTRGASCPRGQVGVGSSLVASWSIDVDPMKNGRTRLEQYNISQGVD
jgi:hypothetical protein